jgi:hypothetical protein
VKQTSSNGELASGQSGTPVEVNLEIVISHSLYLLTRLGELTRSNRELASGQSGTPVEII